MLTGIERFFGELGAAAGAAAEPSHPPRLDRVERPFPRQARSFFEALEGEQHEAVGQRWSSVAGKFYTVYKSTHLLNGFSVLATDVPATAPLNTFTDPLPGGTAFYILSVR